MDARSKGVRSAEERRCVREQWCQGSTPTNKRARSRESEAQGRYCGVQEQCVGGARRGGEMSTGPSPWGDQGVSADELC